MPSLRELQTAIAEGVRTGAFADVAVAVVDDAPGAEARLAIHHHHYQITLIEALAATFPVVRRLVGADFFRQTARAFVVGHPPGGPCLFEYGATFPDFLAALPAAAALGYLPDVARLEWALNEAWFAADAEPLAADALAGLPPAQLAAVRLPLHPSCRLLRSAYPVHRVWQAHQWVDDDAVAPVDLAEGGVRLLVHRTGDEAGWQVVEPGVFALLEALATGAAFAEAAEAAFAAGPCDLVTALARLIRMGALAQPPATAPHRGGEA